MKLRPPMTVFLGYSLPLLVRRTVGDNDMAVTQRCVVY